MKIGFIGTGNMGGALARAAAKGGHTLLLANRTPAKAEALAQELGGTVCPNAEAAETAELLFLGVKPQGLPGLAGELAPEGWKIPSDADWEQLKNYTGNDASILKAGEWQAMVSGEVAPVNNHTRFNAFPVGMWYNKGHNSPNKMTAFWSWDHTKHTLSESTIYFLGESDEFVSSAAHVTGKPYYKALSIRCIKE